ncbi:Uncharacterised protein [uncultured archaeon]|nr:Uncharacterised protein [uncultured archaeon]
MVNARENIDTTYKPEPRGSLAIGPHHADARQGRQDTRKGNGHAGPGRPRCHKAALRRKRSREGTTFKMLARVVEFLKSAKNG